MYYTKADMWLYGIFTGIVVFFVTFILTGVHFYGVGVKECARGCVDYVPQYTIINGDTTSVDTVIVVKNIK